MFGSVAPIGDIYPGREGWMLLLPPCRSPSSQISSLSPVRISSGCKGNASLWYFTPHLNQWSLYLTMPGNYSGTLLDHVNSCRTRAEGGSEEQREFWEGGGCTGLWEKMEMAMHKQKKSRGTKTKHTNTNKPSAFVYLHCFTSGGGACVRAELCCVKQVRFGFKLSSSAFCSGAGPYCEGSKQKVRPCRLQTDALKCMLTTIQINRAVSWVESFDSL